MIRMTVDCVRPTQYNVIITDHSSQCWSEGFFYQFYQNVYLLLLLYIHISFIFHIYCVARCIIITLLQTVCRECQWKNFENRSIIGKDMDKSKVPRILLAHPLYQTISPVYC